MCHYRGTNCTGEDVFEVHLRKRSSEEVIFEGLTCKKCLGNLQRRVWQGKNCRLTYSYNGEKKKRTYG